MAYPSQAQRFDQVTRPMVRLAEPAIVNDLLDALLIPPPDTVTAIQLIDITGNGYGPDDLLLIEPGEQAHFLDTYIPTVLQQVLSQWDMEANYRYEVDRMATENLVVAAHLAEDPEGVIAGQCVEAIDEQYGGDDMEVRISRTGSTVSLEMWAYDANGLTYAEPTAGALCEVQRQRFERAPPGVLTAFMDGATCVEAWQEAGVVQQRPCAE